MSALALALAAALLVPAAGDVVTKRPTFFSDEASVVRIVDGDTFIADVAGERVRVRIAGINTMEIGQCHADEATRRLAELLRSGEVRLSAAHRESASRGRPIRHVYVGRVNVAEVLLREGLALPFPLLDEGHFNDRYAELADAAVRDGIGIWDPDACGAGPVAEARLRIWAQWDADGDDHYNPNGEWVRIANSGEADVPLGGWVVRDSALNMYTFPDWVILPAGAELRLHVGRGVDRDFELHWGLSAPIFDNFAGDGAFLVDPDGDIRAEFRYPCVANCLDPAFGSLALETGRDGEGEWLDVTNRMDRTYDLSGLVLEAFPHVYAFPASAEVGPRQTLRLRLGNGGGEGDVLWWDAPRDALSQAATLRVRTYADATVASTAWSCAAGCAPDTPLVIEEVVYDAPGDDLVNPNGEWVTLRNVGDRVVDLAGWQLRSGRQRLNVLEPTLVRPGSAITVYVGPGEDTVERLYWEQPSGILRNTGDVVELLAPDRRVVACAAYGDAGCRPVEATPPHTGDLFRGARGDKDDGARHGADVGRDPAQVGVDRAEDHGEPDRWLLVERRGSEGLVRVSDGIAWIEVPAGVGNGELRVPRDAEPGVG